MKKLKSLFFAAPLIFAACAATPDYRAATGQDGQGYTNAQIESNRWTVSYQGEPNQSAADVRQYALYRAGELTLEQGGDWFTVIDKSSDETKEETRDWQPGGFESDTEYVRKCGILGCSTRAEPVTRYRSSEIQRETVYTFAHTLEIIVGRGEKPAGDPSAYDARDVLANLEGSVR